MDSFFRPHSQTRFWFEPRSGHPLICEMPNSALIDQGPVVQN